MKENFLICFISCICFGAVICDVEDAEPMDESSSGIDNVVILKDKNADDASCWMKLRAQELFKVMARIDKQYAATRKTVQDFADSTDFDKKMLDAMLERRGAALREITKEKPYHAKIAAGMNLGGICMVRLPESILFFHRMKLRNNTFFRINVLHNDFENMVLKAHLSLNDLHLKGAYERIMTERDPSALIYSPTFGEIEVLLKDVQYSVEGRYRLIKERLVIELILSTLQPQDILLSYVNGSTDYPMKLQKHNLGDFLERLKSDLNKWLLDYFNDFLIYMSLDKVPLIESLQKYDKEKNVQLAVYMDNSIIIIRKKIRTIGGTSIQVPKFRIMTAHGLNIKIYDGVLQGLDTMYRRSVATTVLKRRDFRYVDSIVGFSDLKVIYKYEVSFPVGTPAPPTLTGIIILSGNELTAHLSLGLLREPEVVDIDIDFMNQLGPNSLTVEGAANLLIGNFKHLLQVQILTIMSNTLIYGVGMLRSLPRCEPFVPGQLKKKNRPQIIKVKDRYDANDEEAITNKMINNSEDERNLRGGVRQNEKKSLTQVPKYKSPTTESYYNRVVKSPE